ncbi:MAG: hypothetical protein ABSA32_08865 [Candidatus Acidiferrales bacterium]|jgi:hypothetical protein
MGILNSVSAIHLESTDPLSPQKYGAKMGHPKPGTSRANRDKGDGEIPPSCGGQASKTPRDDQRAARLIALLL